MLNEHTQRPNQEPLRLDRLSAPIAAKQATTAPAHWLRLNRLTLLVQSEIDLGPDDDRRVALLPSGPQLPVARLLERYHPARARPGSPLDPRALITTLAGGDWLRHARNLLICGATGSGKTWLACALAHQAARSGFSVLYVRAARLFDELQVAHGDGSFARRLTQLAKLDLLVIDDFAISPMGPAERNDCSNCSTTASVRARP